MLNTLYTKDNTKKGIQNIHYFHCGPQHGLCVSDILYAAIHYYKKALELPPSVGERGVNSFHLMGL